MQSILSSKLGLELGKCSRDNGWEPLRLTIRPGLDGTVPVSLSCPGWLEVSRISALNRPCVLIKSSSPTVLICSGTACCRHVRGLFISRLLAPNGKMVEWMMNLKGLERRRRLWRNRNTNPAFVWREHAERRQACNCCVSGQYTSSRFYLEHSDSETGFCLRLQVEATQLGPIDTPSLYFRTPTRDKIYKPSTA
jgi:hypothetical protein